MPDKLVDLFNELSKKGLTDFQIFQQGYSAAAVSMRQRAMEVCGKGYPGKPKESAINEITNGIGALPDIAQ